MKTIRYADNNDYHFFAAVVAVFASLFLSDRKEKAKYEAKSNELSSEVMRLKEELAQAGVSGSRRQCIKKDLILEFLRDEEGLECEVMEDSGLIVFKIGDEKYMWVQKGSRVRSISGRATMSEMRKWTGMPWRRLPLP